jgi:hypothetical protein
MKNSNDTIGNLTRDLPVCSVLPCVAEVPACIILIILNVVRVTDNPTTLDSSEATAHCTTNCTERHQKFVKSHSILCAHDSLHVSDAHHHQIRSGLAEGYSISLTRKHDLPVSSKISIIQHCRGNNSSTTNDNVNAVTHSHCLQQAQITSTVPTLI